MIILYIIGGLALATIIACILAINTLGSQISKEEEKAQLYKIKSEEFLQKDLNKK